MDFVDECLDFVKCEVELTKRSIEILNEVSKRAGISRKIFINAAISRLYKDPETFSEKPDNPKDYIFGEQATITVGNIVMDKEIDPSFDALEGLHDEFMEDIDFSSLSGGKEYSEAIHMKARWLGISRADIPKETGIPKRELDELYSKYDNSISSKIKKKITQFLQRNK